LIFGRADVTDISAFLGRSNMTGCIKRFFRIPPRHIALFHFIIEGYDGIATVSTVDSQAAVVVLCIPDGLEGFVDDVLQALAREQSIPFREELEGKEQFREET
jgi:Domain of unknown function (DUF4911)